jgi:hypothetical protein
MIASRKDEFMAIEAEARKAVELALRAGDFEELIRGDYPYSVSEEYMAPSTVPTNWSGILSYGLEEAAQADPGVARKIEDALVSMGRDAEGLYCALAFFRTYLSARSRGPIFGMDVDRIAETIRKGIPALTEKIRALHPSWLHPSENLWERVVRFSELTKRDFGIDLM